MAAVTDMRRRGPALPRGPPEIQHKPGMAKQILRELAPLLAEEGIDVDDIDVPDLPTRRRGFDQAQPESPDNLTATVADCIGVALGLLDEWLSGRDPDAPAGLAQRVRLPVGHWFGERAATDILVLAGKGKAFRSLDSVIARQGGKHVLLGGAQAVTDAIQAWSHRAGIPVPDLTRTAIH